MPTVVQSILRWLVIVVISTFWTVVASARLFLLWWRNRSTFFRVKKHPRPAVLESPEWRHRTIRLSKIQMHIVECVNGNANEVEAAEDEEEERRPLMLFLHGFPEFWYSWRFQLRHFRDKFQAIAVDLRGYNDTDKPPGVANYDFEVLAADIVELILILTRGSQRPVVLVGHDFGAAISWALAIERPELIDRLVIMNVPHPKVFTKMMRTKSSQLLKSWYMFFHQSPWLPELSMWCLDFGFVEHYFLGKTGLVHKDNFSQEDVEAWKYAFSKPNALTPPLNYYRALFRSPDRTHFPYEPVRPKTLIIWGKQDAFFDWEVAEMSGEMCREAKVEMIPDASHWVQQDVPERVNKVMEEWLHDLDTSQ